MSRQKSPGKLQPRLLDEVNQKSSLENVSTIMTAVLSV
jgi:hypothetical protein